MDDGMNRNLLDSILEGKLLCMFMFNGGRPGRVDIQLIQEGRVVSAVPKPYTESKSLHLHCWRDIFLSTREDWRPS